MGHLLEDNGYGHFEEPCPYWELEWIQQVSDALSIPVAGGEQDWDLQQWKRITGMHAVDIAQPDICYIGGVTRFLRGAALADAAGIPCVPHSANHSLVTIFTLHVMGSIANAGKHVEFSIEPQERIGDSLLAQDASGGRYRAHSGRTGLGSGDPRGLAGALAAYGQRATAVAISGTEYVQLARSGITKSGRGLSIIVPLPS